MPGGAVIGWLISWLIDCTTVRSIDWLIDCSAVRSIHWLIDWMTDLSRKGIFWPVLCTSSGNFVFRGPQALFVFSDYLTLGVPASPFIKYYGLKACMTHLALYIIYLAKQSTARSTAWSKLKQSEAYSKNKTRKNLPLFFSGNFTTEKLICVAKTEIIPFSWIFYCKILTKNQKLDFSLFFLQKSC